MCARSSSPAWQNGSPGSARSTAGPRRTAFTRPCQAGLELRAHIQGAAAVFVLGYTDGCPGYLPSAAEYPFGGYEVCDAHRYYGMPGPFAPGSLERLVEEALRLSAVVGAADDQLTGPPRGQ